MKPRILYLATADARGHLMRAQLLVHALHKAGAQVEVLTTSDEGQRFLESFGIKAEILSRHYAVQFDSGQNMLRKATNSNVAHYVFRPGRMFRDIVRLRDKLRSVDLVINDSFHPALLFMGTVPGWRHKVVHVYGASLKVALINNFEGMWPRAFGRLFGWIVGRQIDAARACIEHDFAHEIDDSKAPALFRLPTPVALADTQTPSQPVGAAIYLNPHFSDVSLAEALSAGIADAGLSAHQVGEGYAGVGGWLGVDPDWASRAAQAQLIVSAPGMAALSIARVYRRPIILVLTDQPEQATNAARAAQLQLVHRVVTWRGDVADFRGQVAKAAAELTETQAPDRDGPTGNACAQARIDAWVSRLLSL
ncbi:hypothetical protein [Pseudomonas frederiksbergensis]|uniref:hypothetical protein n=1 Tax=Pseudomonas frederiksbergensis TaxID=104087 RepID=UPI003D1C1D38